MTHPTKTTINIQRVGDHDLEAPQRATDGSAAVDIRACLPEDGTWTLEAGEEKLIPTGFAIELPPGLSGLLIIRSGVARKECLVLRNQVGLIDPDFRNQMMISLHNDHDESQAIRHGERIAQLLIVPYIVADLVEVDELSETGRGAGGFGSSGKA